MPSFVSALRRTRLIAGIESPIQSRVRNLAYEAVSAIAKSRDVREVVESSIRIHFFARRYRVSAPTARANKLGRLEDGQADFAEAEGGEDFVGGLLDCDAFTGDAGPSWLGMIGHARVPCWIVLKVARRSESCLLPGRFAHSAGFLAVDIFVGYVALGVFVDGGLVDGG